MLAENFIFIKCFAVKVDRSDFYSGIYLYKNLFPDSWVDVTPSTLTAKTSMKMKFSANKIYYNFSQENRKGTNI